jgi:hypothetical protein
MDSFKSWLIDDFNKTVNVIDLIPAKDRKGLEVALLRKRARDTETAIKLVVEFESKEQLS